MTNKDFNNYVITLAKNGLTAGATILNIDVPAGINKSDILKEFLIKYSFRKINGTLINHKKPKKTLIICEREDVMFVINNTLHDANFNCSIAETIKAITDENIIICNRKSSFFNKGITNFCKEYNFNPAVIVLYDIYRTAITDEILNFPANTLFNFSSLVIEDKYRTNCNIKIDLNDVLRPFNYKEFYTQFKDGAISEKEFKVFINQLNKLPELHFSYHFNSSKFECIALLKSLFKQKNAFIILSKNRIEDRGYNTIERNLLNREKKILQAFHNEVKKHIEAFNE